MRPPLSLRGAAPTLLLTLAGSTRWGVLLALLLSACVGGPGRGGPGHLYQSFDSATGSCARNPALCARVAGEEPVVPLAVRRLAEAGASTGAVAMVLRPELMVRIERALVECAEAARSQVLLEENQGRSPTSKDCLELIPGTNKTRAMHLGEKMHEVAARCAGVKLAQVAPGHFSLEPRYRYDRMKGKTTFISEEEAQLLLKQWRGQELKGTVRPDVVIHQGDPLHVQRIYDFKFRCDNTQPGEWTEYPEGHVHEKLTQQDVYQDALNADAWRVTPRWGLVR